MVTVGSADFNGTDRGAAGERGKGGQVTKTEWLKDGDGWTDGRMQSSKETKRCWMEVVSSSEGVCDELLPWR